MVQYLTPTRYKWMAIGGEHLGAADSDLESFSRIASSMVNRYCAAPRDHDFRGGTVEFEKHRWLMGNTYRPGTIRLYPYHKPIQHVDGFRIDISNTQYVSLQPSDLYVNEVENWVQPIALAVTTAGIFGFSILPGIGLREPVAKLSYKYGWQFSVVDEELTTYSGSTLMAANQFWLTDEEITVKANGTTLTSGIDYSYDAVEGFVSVSNYDSATHYSASYTYPLPVEIAQATAWIMNDLTSQANLTSTGLLGLSGLRVEEVELRQSSKLNIYVEPINGVAATLLDAFIYRSIG